MVASHHPAQGRAAREPSVAVALGWFSCVRGASLSGANVAETRDPRFGGRHRTSRSRVRWLRGVHGSRGPRRGTWRPDMHSRRVKAVFIRIRARSCTDRSSSRAPRHAHPAALRPPQSEERSDQIEAVGATCGPSRPKRLLVVTQGHRGVAQTPGRGIEPQATNLRVRYATNIWRWTNWIVVSK